MTRRWSMPSYVTFGLRFAGGARASEGIALDCGYYDQAHLNREMRAFTGTCPTKFLAALAGNGTGHKQMRLAGLARRLTGSKMSERGFTDREDQFRQAALELVGELGYDCVTMDAIASKTRSSKATLYRRWSSKEELVTDALRRRIAPILDAPDTGSLASDLVELLGPVVEELSRDIDMALSLLAAARRDAPLMELLKNNLYGQFYSRVGVLVERAVRRGELPVGADPLIGARAAAAIMLFRAAWNEGPLDAQFVVHIVEHIMLPIFHTSLPAYEPKLDHPAR